MGVLADKTAKDKFSGSPGNRIRALECLSIEELAVEDNRVSGAYKDLWRRLSIRREDGQGATGKI